MHVGIMIIVSNHLSKATNCGTPPLYCNSCVKGQRGYTTETTFPDFRTAQHYDDVNWNAYDNYKNWYKSPTKTVLCDFTK